MEKMRVFNPQNMGYTNLQPLKNEGYGFPWHLLTIHHITSFLAS